MRRLLTHPALWLIVAVIVASGTAHYTTGRRGTATLHPVPAAPGGVGQMDKTGGLADLQPRT